MANGGIEASDRAWPSLALFGGGIAIAVVASIVQGALPRSSSCRTGTIEVWAADRGANRVFGLDRDGIVARTIHVAAPLALASAGAGGVWVVHALEAHAGAPQCLDLFTFEGVRVRELALDTCLDVGSDREGRALVIARAGSGETCAWRIAHDGAREKLLEEPGLTSIAAWASSIVVGTRAGKLTVLEGDRARRLDVGIAIDDIACARGSSALWILDAHEPARLGRVDERGALAWSSPVGFAVRSLAPIQGEGTGENGRETCVWLAESGGARARRFGAGGAIEADCNPLLHAGVEAALGLDDGGVLLAVPGAILRHGARGEVRPGQGGFHTLVALARR